MSASRLEQLWVPVQGNRVRCTAAGRGFPVLLLPGWGGPTDKYEPLQKTLAGMGYRTIVPDLPGLPGETDAVFMSLDRWGRWVEELARASMSAPFALISHSFSAMVAAQYLSNRSPECLGAVFIAPWLFSSGAQAGFWRAIARIGRLLAPAIYPDMKWVRDSIAWKTTQQLYTQQRWKAGLPCLVLWGRKDLPRHLFTGWKKLACETRVYGWGHSPQILNTDELAGVIDAFVRGLSSAPKHADAGT